MFINAISPHGLGVWAAYAQEIILRDFLGQVSGAKKVQLKIINDPFPLGKDFSAGLEAIQGFLLAFGVGIVYICVAPNIIRVVVEEREKNLKNQMIVSGVRLPAYWIGHYTKDLFFGLILGVCVIVLIIIFDVDLEYGWVMILLGAIAQPPFLYGLSFCFDKADSSSGIVTFSMFIFTFIGPIALFVLQIIESTRNIAVALKWSLSIVPQFAVTSSMYIIAFKQLFGFLEPADGDCGEKCDYSEPGSFDDRIAKPQLIMLIISSIVWWFLIAFIDSSLWKMCVRIPNPSED